MRATSPLAVPKAGSTSKAQRPRSAAANSQGTRDPGLPRTGPFCASSRSFDLYNTLDKDQADRQWSNLSFDYARHASGEVQAFTQTKSAQHRVFQPTEQPELRNNPNIDTIKYRHWENGIESTHVERQGRTPDAGWDQTLAKRQAYKDYMLDRVHEGGPRPSPDKDGPAKSK